MVESGAGEGRAVEDEEGATMESGASSDDKGAITYKPADYAVCNKVMFDCLYLYQVIVLLVAFSSLPFTRHTCDCFSFVYMSTSPLWILRVMIVA